MSSHPVTVRVDLGPRSYDIQIGRGLLSSLPETLNSLNGGAGRSALMVCDANVRPHADGIRREMTLAGWRCEEVVLPPGESSKSLDNVSLVYDRLIDMQADRRTLVVAVGGGVIGDLAGFAAATWVRGVPFVQVPTTLLAAVDSSVGGKTGVNHPRAKNMIGAFHQPVGVVIDLATFDTLPNREYRSGLAEVVKYGVILSEPFFAELERSAALLLARDPEVLTRVVAASCRFKADVVEQDEFERTGVRAILNYGHTFAHAFEALCGYGVLLHGEAVSIGMVYAARLALKRGLVDEGFCERQLRLITALGLPTALPAGVRLGADEVIQRMRLDKKSVGGSLRFVLPTRMGRVEVFGDVPEGDVRGVLEGLRT